MKLKVVLFAVLFSLSLFATETPRPNVIFLLCDDLGYGDVGYVQQYRPTGSVLIETPVIDNLALSGTILTDHYCASPVCAPSRASIMTGKLAHSCSMNCADKNMCYDHAILETETLGSVMRDAGYETYAIGKWGIGGGGETESKLGANAIPRIAHPLARGFDHYYGFLDHAAGHTYYHYDDILNNCYAGIYESSTAKDVRPAGFEGSEYDTKNSANMIPENDPNWKYWNATKTAEGRYSTDLFMARAMKYIEDHVKENEEAGTERPFFMYFAINTVHGAGRKTKTVNGQTVVQNNTLGEYDADIHIPGGEYVSARNGDGSVKWPLDPIEMSKRNQWVDPRYQNTSINNVSKRYATSITRMDTALGDLVQFLKDKGIYENTIIIFTSDNGAAAEYGYNPSYLGSTGEFRGHKRDVLDGGQRIPAFISWPGKPAASKKVISEPSISPDWMGALKELIKDPTHVPVPVSQRVETIYISDGQSGQQRMKRIGDIVTVQQNGFGNKVQTYNIEDDRHQDHPLTDEYLPGFRYRFNGDFADSGLPCTFGSPNVLTAVGESMGTFVAHGDRQALKIAHGVTGQDENGNDYKLGRFQSVKSSLGNGSNNAAFTVIVNAKVAPASGKKAVLWSFGGESSNFAALAADATNNKLYWYANGMQRAEIGVPNMAADFHHYTVVGNGSTVSILVDGITQASLTANYPTTSANTYGLGAPSIAMDMGGLVEAVDTEIEDFAVYQQRALTSSEIGSTIAPVEVSDTLTLNIPTDCEIATEFTGTGKIIKQGAGAVRFTGTLPSGGLEIDLSGVDYTTPFKVASFLTVPDLSKIKLSNANWQDRLVVYGKSVVVLSRNETLKQPRVIALNLNAGQGRNGNGSDANKLADDADAEVPNWVIPGFAWKQVTAASQSSPQDLIVFDENTRQVVTDLTTKPKVTWSANNNYTVDNGSVSVLNGYLDDGGTHAQVSMTDIPFTNYDALIICATDTASMKFSPVTVNDKLYKADENGEGIESASDGTWGQSQNTSIALGVNAFFVRGLTSSELSIVGGANVSKVSRGGIAAVVLFEQTELINRITHPVKIIVR